MHTDTATRTPDITPYHVLDVPAPPCDSCPHQTRCALERLGCKRFRAYLNLESPARIAQAEVVPHRRFYQ